jgi:hypothetical protein
MPATDLMKTLKIIGAVLIVVLALAWLQRSMNPKPIEDEAMPPYAVGQVLAEQAAKATGDKGRLAMVWMPINSVRGQAELAGFQETIALHKHITLTATNLFKPSETAFGSMSFQQLAAVVNEDTNVDVIVSFLGVTSFTDAQMATLPNPSPKLVVMDWNPGDVQRGMKAGLVKAAVMSRRLTGIPSDHPKTPHQWFDRYYDLVTPESSGNP